VPPHHGRGPVVVTHQSRFGDQRARSLARMASWGSEHARAFGDRD
jgi:hypothetical protein